MTTPTNDRREVLAAVEESLRKRLDDWLESTSEVYARADETGQAWRSGLVGYLLRGPGALDAALAAQEGERGGAEVALRECGDYLTAMDSAGGGIYTTDFRSGFRHALSMFAAALEPTTEGQVSPAVREAARFALGRLDGDRS